MYPDVNALTDALKTKQQLELYALDQVISVQIEPQVELQKCRNLRFFSLYRTPFGLATQTTEGIILQFLLINLMFYKPHDKL